MAMDQLHEQIEHQTHHAKQVGALQPLTTAQVTLEDQGISFVIRILEELKRKESYQAKQKVTKVNPFLPYEEDLYVCDLYSEHICLLNKFNVADHHILIVTRDFQPQTHWLTQQDFNAVAYCLQRLDGLAFYNAGAIAGASQPHRHLQLIPFNSGKAPFVVPMNEILTDLAPQPQTHLSLPFRHAVMPLSSHWDDGQYLFDCYLALLRYLQLIDHSVVAGPQTQAYNLLVTQRWMLLVHRVQAKYQNIPVNALGYAGALLVRSHSQLSFLKELTPLTLLTKVAAPLTESHVF